MIGNWNSSSGYSPKPTRGQEVPGQHFKSGGLIVGIPVRSRELDSNKLDYFQNKIFYDSMITLHLFCKTCFVSQNVQNWIINFELTVLANNLKNQWRTRLWFFFFFIIRQTLKNVKGYIWVRTQRARRSWHILQRDLTQLWLLPLACSP